MDGGPRGSSASRWIGHALGALACLQLFFSAGVKLAMPPGVPEHFAALGWQPRDVAGLALLEAACTLLYLVPRTAAVGAILLTGYLGGAAAAHVRIGDAVFLYPVGLGVALWAGLYLRDPRLRALLAPRNSASRAPGSSP